MGMAIDTVLAFNTQAGAGAFPITLAAAAGDNLRVRSFREASKAYLETFVVQSNAVAQKFRITSALLHDNVTGLTFLPPENPAGFLTGRVVDIELQSQDTLLVQGSCAAAYTITAGLVIRYENIRGAEADLRTWPDIKSHVKFVKSVEGSLSAIAVGAWTDTLITNTEQQLHADYDYAVLGYVPSVAVGIIGVKGEATNNLRVCGPGMPSTLDITEYFIRMSELGGKPFIPVFNANDRNAFYVSSANGASLAGGAAEVSLIVAQLDTKLG